MDDNKVVEVGVYVNLHSLDIAKQDAKDMAWDHSINGANMLNITVGSDDHVRLYKLLDERYQHGVDHMMFFMQHSLVLLSAMFETDFISLKTDKGPLTEAEVRDKLGTLTQLICGSYMWLAASHETVLWSLNEDMPDSVGATFYFTEDEITIDNDTTEKD